MQKLKDVGLWLGGAFVALVLMYVFGSMHRRGNGASVVYIGYLIFWALQFVYYSIMMGRFAYDEGRMSNTGAYIKEIFRRFAPMYLIITAMLLVDSIINTQLAQNWLTFAAMFVVSLYLSRRDENRQQATSLLRGSRANIASTEQRREGPQGRYAGIAQQQDVIEAPTPQPVQAAQSYPSYEEWVKTASPEDIEAVRLQAEKNEREEQQARNAQRPASRYAHLKNDDEEG